MEDNYKIISVRLRQDEDADLIAYLTRTGSPVSQIRALWSATHPVKKEPDGNLRNHLFQLRHVIERTDTDRLLMNISEEEYVDVMKSIEKVISRLERDYL